MYVWLAIKKLEVRDQAAPRLLVNYKAVYKSRILDYIYGYLWIMYKILGGCWRWWYNVRF